jgi:hypothetical protein
MTFRLFIYYCALGGGWAAFLAWGLLALLGVATVKGKDLSEVALIGTFLGLLVAAALGLVDGLLNSTGNQRYLRVLVSAGIGLVGGALGAVLGTALYEAGGRQLIWLVAGWMVAGLLIGAASGLHDVLQAQLAGRELRQPVKKTLNGIYGGVLGGFLGGFPFGLLLDSQTLPLSGLAIGLTVLGLCIGLMVALAQVFLKEAWVAVEIGRRAGRQMMLSKDETTIGRAEGCDLGLFGEQGIEKVHARIMMRNSRYVLEDANTPGGTFINESRVERPTLLNNGDAIRVGSCLLRFGESQKQR